MVTHKLNKIAFATLVKFITELQHERMLDLEELDNLISIEVPETVNGVTPQLIEAFLVACLAGRRIEAIQHHRAMTGFGLKESKEFIDKYVLFKAVSDATLYTIADLRSAMNAKIWNVADHSAIERFISELKA